MKATNLYRSEERGLGMDIRKCCCGGHASVKGRAHKACICVKCGMRGPECFMKEDAIIAWNDLQKNIEKGKKYDNLGSRIKEGLIEQILESEAK